MTSFVIQERHFSPMEQFVSAKTLFVLKGYDIANASIIPAPDPNVALVIF